MDAGKYAFRENGRSLWVRYSGKNEDPGQMTIVEGTTTGLTGDNISYYSNTSVPYNTNLFYDPVPFEWLRTPETQPQLEVTVNGEPAVCHNLTCGYAYTAPVGTVTAFTYNAATRVLQLSGTDLPVNTSLIRNVTFAKSPCTIDPATVSATGLTCTLK